MIKVKIISKVDIPPIKESVIAELIKQEILRTNPELTINDVSFERKLNPQRIEATVDAQLGGKPTKAETVTDFAPAPANIDSLTKVEPIKIEEIKLSETVSDLFD